MIKLPEIFTDNMILRHNAPCPVWGECDGDRVYLLLDGQQVDSTSGSSFELTLPAQVSGGCHTLCISSGGEQVVLHNVSFGEVWLAGGQSNMEYRLNGDCEYQSAKLDAQYPMVRQFAVPQAAHKDARALNPEKFAAAPVWTASSADTCGDFSAVAWWAAAAYNRQYGVPVGIVYCNWGGTSASCWLDSADLAGDPTAKLYLDDYDKAMEGISFERYVEIYTEYYAGEERWRTAALRLMEEEGLDDKTAFSDPRAGKCPDWPPPQGPWAFTSPAHLYEGMLSTVIPYGLTRILWYQGEEDVRVCERYHDLLRLLITCWRKYFRDEQLPFDIITIAPYAYQPEDPTLQRAAYIRQAQCAMPYELDGVSVTVTTDCGCRTDIHPTSKRVIGERLFAIMREQSGEAVDARSPRAIDISLTENGAVVVFDKALMAGPVEGFTLCDADKVWHKADAVADGCSVTVIGLNAPIAVRYAFADYIDSSLYGQNGLPAQPMRSDSFRPDESDMSNI